MSDMAIISLCILINVICLIVVVVITIHNFRKAYKLIREDIREMRRRKELEEIEILKELE